ncbi:hypothetical protein D3C83_189070 [compost metagenome]
MTFAQYGWDLATIPTTADRVAKADAEAVRQAAIRYLNVGNYVRVSLLPEIGSATAGNP